MKVANFEYHAPTTVHEAVTCLAQLAKEDVRILAGGQSLIPAMAFRLASPNHLVDINGIAELDRMLVEGGELVIGAGIRHASFTKPVIPGRFGRLLSEVAAHIAHYPIRSRGTLCGSLAHADPASEWCLVAVTFDAVMVAQSVRGSRTIPAREFFSGLMTTALAEDELLTEARITIPADQAALGFYEFSRRSGDYAIGMALAHWVLVDGKMKEVRIGIGAVESKPRRIEEAEAVLEGQAPSPAVFAEAAEVVASSVHPIEDLQANADYRRQIARVVTKRALTACAEDKQANLA